MLVKTTVHGWSVDIERAGSFVNITAREPGESQESWFHVHLDRELAALLCGVLGASSGDLAECISLVRAAVLAQPVKYEPYSGLDRSSGARDA